MMNFFILFFLKYESFLRKFQLLHLKETEMIYTFLDEFLKALKTMKTIKTHSIFDVFCSISDKSELYFPLS